MYVDNAYRYKDLSWKGLSLLYKKKETGLILVKDEKYDWMYWIVRKPDFKSKNFYNLINGKENTKLFFLEHMNSDVTDINEIKLPSSHSEAQGEV